MEEREALRARGDAGRDREHEERRRPLREHDVLEQVRPQERVQRERLEARDEGGGDQRERDDERREARPAGAQREAEDREDRDEDDGLRREIHGATLALRARGVVGNTRAFQARVAGSCPAGRFGSVRHSRYVVCCENRRNNDRPASCVQTDGL